jgi:hypothetical protein
MPPLVRTLLVGGAAPSSVDPREVLCELKLAKDAHLAALSALVPVEAGTEVAGKEGAGAAEDDDLDEASVVRGRGAAEGAPTNTPGTRTNATSTNGQNTLLPLLRLPGVLSAAECTALVDYCHGHGLQTKVDSVDGQPDFQYNIRDKAELVTVLGARAVGAIWRLPQALEASAPHGDDFEKVGVFMRSYSVGGRPFIPFHCDSARYTANIALNADEDFAGGKLLVLYDDQVRAIERATGEVTAHPSTLMHGVSSMTAGTRHSLIVFFH